MFAKEIRSGREVRLRLADLEALGRLPFGNEADTAVESYSAVAELNCCEAHGVPMPANPLCTYAEQTVRKLTEFGVKQREERAVRESERLGLIGRLTRPKAPRTPVRADKAA